MKKNKNQIIFSIGTIFSIVPIALTISCNNETKKPYKNEQQYKNLKKHKFEKRNDEFNIDSLPSTQKNDFYNAKIVNWIDGDTPKVDFYDKNWKKLSNNEKNNVNIRVTNIDTPELHVKDESGSYVVTKGEEFILANNAKNFGDKEMPVGTKIKIYTSWTKSYNRVVGSIFYKNEQSSSKYKSYSVEIIRNGLAMPLVNSSNFSGLDFSLGKTPNIFDYIGWSFADAYNYSVREKRGIFSDGAHEELRVHGSPDTSFVDWREEEPGQWDSLNIYEVMKVNKEDI